MNKKIKVIELLNKIANGEEVPKKINYLGIEYKLMNQDYKDESRNLYLFSEELQDVLDVLNEEVEILEDNTEEIEGLSYEWSNNEIADRVDKLIKAVNQIRKDIQK